MRINKGIKRLWLEALRSGKYLQGSNQLRENVENETYYCCLAVLGEICGLEITKGGMCFVDDVEFYSSLNPFISPSDRRRLADANDQNISFSRRDYSGVIPLIEILKTTE